MYKYIEIIKFDNNAIIKRIDVSDSGSRSIDRIKSGININLNHDEFHTVIKESEIELD